MAPVDPTTTVHLLSDNRLSEAARIIGLWLAHQEGDEEGWAEMPFDAVRPLLYGFPSDDTIRRHLRMLTSSGWVDRKPGGRGHGDRYRLKIDPQRTRAYPIDSEMDPSLKPDRPASQPGLNEQRGGDKGGGSSREKQDASPSIISPNAAELIDANTEQLAGCRGALSDYLIARVAPDRQRSFVGTVLSYLNGLDENLWGREDGSRLRDPKERVGILAVALNELGATDEQKGRKHDPGDPINLRNKIIALVNGYGSRNGHRGPAAKTRSSPKGRGGRKGINDRWNRETPEGDASDPAA